MHHTSDPPFSKFTRQAGKLIDSVNQGYYGFCHNDQTWSPNVNLYETPAVYRVCVDLAGVDKSRIDLTIRGNILLVAGERPVPRLPVAAHAGGGSEEEPDRRARVHRMEIDHGPFCREVELPADVDQEAISASYRNGLLWIEIPKRG